MDYVILSGFTSLTRPIYRRCSKDPLLKLLARKYVTLTLPALVQLVLVNSFHFTQAFNLVQT